VSDSAPLNLDRIRQASFIRSVEWHDVISSTNDRGMELARSTDVVTPTLILAAEQTAGRGRGLNRWWSDRGALTFSLVFDPDADLARRGAQALETDRWPRIALAAGVALCDVLQVAVPKSPCSLKWPNDLLLAGKKVAGILVEVPPLAPPAPRRLVLGMGWNVNNSLSTAPHEVRNVGTSFHDVAGIEFDITQLLIDWLDHFARHLRSLAAGDPALPARWQALCSLTGREIELLSGNRRVTGVCGGIDSDGALLITTAAGPERLYAGVLVRIIS
jgi:BirA family biotin operon repressor/biotin-[acetyl-CoA-carboxylase] ligase